MSNAKKHSAYMKSVTCDQELEGGIFKIGERYHIRTLTYQYTGTLVACTSTVFVFEDTATVYETGAYPQFYGSGGNSGQTIEPHTGAGEMIVDRGGVVLHRFLK